MIPFTPFSHTPYVQCPVCGIRTITTKDGETYYACGYKRSTTINTECGSFKVEPVGPTKCTCDDKALFWGGCKCGWWEKEKALNENNSRIAQSNGI